MQADRLRDILDRGLKHAQHARLHVAPEIPPEALDTLAALCPPMTSDEQLLLFADMSEEEAMDAGLALTTHALYATELPGCHIRLDNLLSETLARREGEGWLYVNDLLLCELPAEDTRLPDLLIGLLRAVRMLRFEAADHLDPLELRPEAPEPSLAWLEELSHRAADADLLAGKYRVLRELGSGTYGTVSLARDIRLDKLVAIKQLTCHSARNARSQARFIQEARALSRLDHPGIATVHALEFCQGNYLLVMEYLCGGSLLNRLDANNRLPLAEVLRIARDILHGLAAAHAEGIVHRDLKPGNILFDSQGRATLTDFGIAHIPAAIGGLELTNPGTPIGTVLYMAPEQVRSDPIDGRCDLYAMGALLYRMLSGDTHLDRRRCRTLHLAFQEILEGTPPPLLGIAEPLAEVVRRLLAKRPEDRYENATAVLQALNAAVPASGNEAALAATLAESTSVPSPQSATSGAEKYRKALKLAMVDGILVQRERDMLSGLAAKWCVSPAQAEAMQAEAMAQAGVCYTLHDILDVEEMVRIFLTDGLLQTAERAMLTERSATCGISEEVLSNIIEIVAHELGIEVAPA